MCDLVWSYWVELLYQFPVFYVSWSCSLVELCPCKWIVDVLSHLGCGQMAYFWSPDRASNLAQCFLCQRMLMKHLPLTCLIMHPPHDLPSRWEQVVVSYLRTLAPNHNKISWHTNAKEVAHPPPPPPSSNRLMYTPKKCVRSEGKVQTFHMAWNCNGKVRDIDQLP